MLNKNKRSTLSQFNDFHSLSPLFSQFAKIYDIPSSLEKFDFVPRLRLDIIVQFAIHYYGILLFPGIAKPPI